LQPIRTALNSNVASDIEYLFAGKCAVIAHYETQAFPIHVVDQSRAKLKLQDLKIPGQLGV